MFAAKRAIVLLDGLQINNYPILTFLSLRKLYQKLRSRPIKNSHVKLDSEKEEKEELSSYKFCGAVLGSNKRKKNQMKKKKKFSSWKFLLTALWSSSFKGEHVLLTLFTNHTPWLPHYHLILCIPILKQESSYTPYKVLYILCPLMGFAYFD